MKQDITIVTNSKDLEQSLAYLEKISNRLRFYGSLTLIFTILNFASQIFSFYVRYTYIPGYLVIFFIIYLPIILSLIAVIVIVRYESLRKRGDALFEEISDELQWNVRQKESGKMPLAPERPMLKARITLRSFARATDIPLVPGKYGPGIYTTINLFLLLLGLVIFRAGRF